MHGDPSSPLPQWSPVTGMPPHADTAAQPHAQPYAQPVAYPQPDQYAGLHPYGYPVASGWPTAPAQPYGYPPQPYPGWPAPGWPSTWPVPPRRPAVATAAAVLGFVTAGIVALCALASAADLSEGTRDPVDVAFLVGLLCPAGLIAGGVRLLRGRPPRTLLVSAVAAASVLVAAGVVAVVANAGEDPAERVYALGFFGVLAVLPVLTAVFAAQGCVARWATERAGAVSAAPPGTGR